MHLPSLDGLDGSHGLKAGGGAEAVPNERLGPVDLHVLEIVRREDLAQRLDLGDVANQRARGVAVDVVGLLLVNARVLQGQLNARGHTEAVLAWVSHMVCVARDAATEVLSDDLGPALLCVLQRLKHEHAGALSHDKAVAALVPRARRLGRLVVAAGRERTARHKASKPRRHHGRLGAAHHHDVGLAVADVAGGGVERIVGGRARGRD
mmetsp:Transcript_14084/g.40875  ORF Transcript_14084/g.40875 Transcript_14084/m.40875 type:complete len:208 (+) Transcript_14084:826-1449(+)